GDQLGEGELERVEADLEGGLLVEVGLPVDAALLLLGFELLEPAVAVGVAELVECECLVAFEPVAVVEGEGVVDAAAEEHRAVGGEALAEQVVPAPVLRAQQEA